VIEAPPIGILIADDHPLLREGIATVIRSQPDMKLMAEASTGSQAVRLCLELRPDIVLMDLRLPDMSGIDALANIRMHFSEARVIILTTFEGDAEVQRALKAGARSYLLKSMTPNEILANIRLVHAGKVVVPPEVAAHLLEFMNEDALSEREIEVLRQVAEGKSNRDAGAKLFITEETVKIHMRHIMEKLGASDRTQAVAIAVRRGYFQL
jgi:DNA-binding NarL/FixJ family response regulator